MFLTVPSGISVVAMFLQCLLSFRVAVFVFFFVSALGFLFFSLNREQIEAEKWQATRYGGVSGSFVIF
jgi:hypothetical protein